MDFTQCGTSGLAQWPPQFWPCPPSTPALSSTRESPTHPWIKLEMSSNCRIQALSLRLKQCNKVKRVWLTTPTNAKLHKSKWLKRPTSTPASTTWPSGSITATWEITRTLRWWWFIAVLYFSVREAFKSNFWKNLGFRPNWGGGVCRSQIFIQFFQNKLYYVKWPEMWWNT